MVLASPRLTYSLGTGPRSVPAAAKGKVSFVLCVCDIADRSHVFFLQASADGRLGGFPASAVVRGAAVDSGVRLSLGINPERRAFS